jgi:hypothetical protein
MKPRLYSEKSTGRWNKGPGRCDNTSPASRLISTIQPLVGCRRAGSISAAPPIWSPARPLQRLDKVQGKPHAWALHAILTALGARHGHTSWLCRAPMGQGSRRAAAAAALPSPLVTQVDEQAESRIQNPESRIRNPEPLHRSRWAKIQNPESRIRSPSLLHRQGRRILDLEFWTLGIHPCTPPGFWILDSGFWILRNPSVAS